MDFFVPRKKITTSEINTSCSYNSLQISMHFVLHWKKYSSAEVHAFKMYIKQMEWLGNFAVISIKLHCKQHKYYVQVQSFNTKCHYSC